MSPLAVAALILSLQSGPDLPQGDPPQPAAKRINVAEFGAKLEDDDHDDTSAVSAAVKAAGNETTLYFPAGTYNIRWVAEIKGFDGLSIQGDGPAKSILKRMGPYWKPGAEPTQENLQKNYAMDSKILRIEDCRNMCIRDIAFDANGTPTFGGVGIKRPRRLNVTNTRCFDSREQPPLFGKDRFGWILHGFQQGCQDVWFVDNVVEGLQTEMDSTCRVLVERSVFRRSVKSPGLGFLSGNFSAKKYDEGYSNTHITVRRNYFSNSADLSMGMVTFQLDPGTNCNTRFQDVEIVNNVFVYDVDSPNGHVAIKLGVGDSSATTKGNVYERFRIEGNRIYRSPKAAVGEKFNAYIWFNTWAGEDRFHRSTIRGNRLFADGAAKPLVAIGRQNQSLDLVTDDNLVQPWAEPPAIQDVVK